MLGTKDYETILEANIYSSNTCHVPAGQVRLVWHVAFGPSPHGPAIPGRRPARSPPLPIREPTLPSLLCLGPEASPPVPSSLSVPCVPESPPTRLPSNPPPLALGRPAASQI